LTRARRLAVLGAALTLAALPATAARAQSPGSPFTPGLPFPQPSVPTTTTPQAPATTIPSTTTTSGSGGLSGSGVLAIAIGALVVLGGISFFIWWDSRKRAPVRARDAALAAGGVGRRTGSKAPPKPRKLSPAERRRRKRGRAR
jgi:hypothetical protein